MLNEWIEEIQRSSFLTVSISVLHSPKQCKELNPGRIIEFISLLFSSRHLLKKEFYIQSRKCSLVFRAKHCLYEKGMSPVICKQAGQLSTWLQGGLMELLTLRFDEEILYSVVKLIQRKVKWPWITLTLSIFFIHSFNEYLMRGHYLLDARGIKRNTT